MVYKIVTGSLKKSQLAYTKSFRNKAKAKQKAKELRGIFGFPMRVVRR